MLDNRVCFLEDFFQSHSPKGQGSSLNMNSSLCTESIKSKDSAVHFRFFTKLNIHNFHVKMNTFQSNLNAFDTKLNTFQIGTSDFQIKETFLIK